MKIQNSKLINAPFYFRIKIKLIYQLKITIYNKEIKMVEDTNYQ